MLMRLSAIRGVLDVEELIGQRSSTTSPTTIKGARIVRQASSPVGESLDKACKVLIGRHNPCQSLGIVERGAHVAGIPAEQ
jgi:hypothetical protein